MVEKVVSYSTENSEEPFFASAVLDLMAVAPAGPSAFALPMALATAVGAGWA
jgi:hypothetical protein